MKPVKFNWVACTVCMYCKAHGRQQSQKRSVGRVRYWCTHPRADEESAKFNQGYGHPFIGFGENTWLSPLALKTTKRWCPLRTAEEGESK